MARKANGQFKKGESGNPSGRPTRTETEKQTMESICKLAPQAIKALIKLLEADDTPPNVRIRAIELVIERVCGKVQPLNESDEKTLERLDDILFEVRQVAYETC